MTKRRHARRARVTIAVAMLATTVLVVAACAPPPPVATATPRATSVATTPVAQTDHAVRSDAATPAATASAIPTAAPTPATVQGPFEGDLTVKVGTTVTFTNDLGDGEPHSVTARDGSFDTGLLLDGQSATITFNTPGKYPYFCVIHSNMFGTITVVK